MNLQATEPRAPERRPGRQGTCAGRCQNRWPRIHGHSLRSARRRRTGCGPCWQEAWGEPQPVCSGSCSLFRSSLYLSRAVYLLPGQRYSISWSYKAALNFLKPTRCPPWSSSVAAEPRGGKADRNARRRKSPQGQGYSHLPRSRDPRDHSTPMKLLTPRRHILETRVDHYILDALSSRLLSVVASCAPYRQERGRE
jgi:hypothetical protein